jgi:hypothetical protein
MHSPVQVLAVSPVHVPRQLPWHVCAPCTEQVPVHIPSQRPESFAAGVHMLLSQAGPHVAMQVARALGSTGQLGWAVVKNHAGGAGPGGGGGALFNAFCARVEMGPHADPGSVPPETPSSASI